MHSLSALEVALRSKFRLKSCEGDRERHRGSWREARAAERADFLLGARASRVERTLRRAGRPSFKLTIDAAVRLGMYRLRGTLVANEIVTAQHSARLGAYSQATPREPTSARQLDAQLIQVISSCNRALINQLQAGQAARVTDEALAEKRLGTNRRGRCLLPQLMQISVTPLTRFQTATEL